MSTISHGLETAFRLAFTELGLSTDTPLLLAEASRPEFGDYQLNGAMGAAKALKTNPRELATKIIAVVKLDGIAKLDIAGPGFINIILDNNYLSTYVSSLNDKNKYGVLNIGHKPQKVVVDLSSPNLSKEMHVGHLRSTVIGDSLARMFEYLGDIVVRQNHVGDWGTQFGMLIAYLQANSSGDINNFTVSDLEKFYQGAKRRFDEDENFANIARQEVVKLQSSDPEILKLWNVFRKESLRHCQEVYDTLNVNLNNNDVMGESAYNEQLPKIINDLEQKNLLIESDGAKCVFFAEGELTGGEETPFIVQKNDGGYLYATTDLAAMNYRVNQLKADRIVYVVDARQSFHFKQLFVIGRKAGYANSSTQLEHSAFGTMMNEDGRPFKTRDGGTVRLIDLINESKLRAKNIVEQRNPEWDEKDKAELANILAIDAIKYSDLAKNRNSDYIFSFDKMLAFDGNTAPYLLYAYTRVQSILKKAKEVDVLIGDKIIIIEPTEHKLALHIAKFADMLSIASRDCMPHHVCQYLYELAGLFMRFYEACSILKAADKNTQESRLGLANMTAEVLKTGLHDILGIEVIDGMRM